MVNNATSTQKLQTVYCRELELLSKVLNSNLFEVSPSRPVHSMTTPRWLLKPRKEGRASLTSVFRDKTL